MTRSQRLDPLMRVAQQRQDDAARQLAERDRAHAEQEQRLEALRRYAAEYATAPASVSIAPALLANRLAFRAQLDTAVERQHGIVDRSRQTLELERARLMLASRDSKVLEQLAASYRAEETRAGEQRSQRELDELGARSAARLRQAQASGDEE